MNGKIFLAVLAVGLAGCNKKPEEPNPGEAPATAAAQVGVSSAGLVGQTLNAPGNYVRNLAGSLDKAKGVADMVNKQAAARESQDEQYKTGGN